MTVISDTNCPVAVVPAPPAVMPITFALVMVPANVSLAPDAYDVTLLKLGLAPTVAALVGTASA